MTRAGDSTPSATYSRVADIVGDSGGVALAFAFAFAGAQPMAAFSAPFHGAILRTISRNLILIFRQGVLKERLFTPFQTTTYQVV